MHPEFALPLGKIIAQWRNEFGMTQEQLANALDVDPVTVSRFERGVTMPSVGTLSRISTVFNVSLSRFLDDLPPVKPTEAATLSALMANLSPLERDYVVDLVRRFCAFVAAKQTRED